MPSVSNPGGSDRGQNRAVADDNEAEDMSDTIRHICWVLLLLSGLLPLTLGALKRVWIKISVWHRFEPDFARSFRTFFFGGLRENVNYAPPWENMWIVITCGLIRFVVSNETLSKLEKV